MRKKIATKPKIVESSSGRWYVYFQIRDPRTGKMRPYKSEKGFKSLKTREAKIKHGERLSKELLKKLQTGWMPWRDPDSIYEDQINYKKETDSYSSQRKSSDSIRRLLSDYLAEKKGSLKKKTYQTYQSRLRAFNQFVEEKGMSDYDISCIDNRVVLEFFHQLINEKELDMVTVKNYKIIMTNFFKYVLTRRPLMVNPVYNIPKGKKLTDNAPRPILESDMERLMLLIKKNDPQLYLACMMQFFCAVRPGTELRMLKIKDFNFFTKTITINSVDAKTSARRVIGIPDQFYNLLVIEYKIQNYDREYYLFGKTGKPGTRPVGINNFRYKFNHYRDTLGLSSDYKYYSMKHTGACYLINQKEFTIKDIQKHLGHKDINSTNRYIENIQGTLSEKLKSSFPDPFSGFSSGIEIKEAIVENK